ncbi:hypothetical protein B0T13DRAFT_103931 [Neurospora crassa]|nr:hypothetical protein B0T13DRAFT_103931 [Neurospora crassa]
MVPLATLLVPCFLFSGTSPHCRSSLNTFLPLFRISNFDFLRFWKNWMRWLSGQQDSPLKSPTPRATNQDKQYDDGF